MRRRPNTDPAYIRCASVFAVRKSRNRNTPTPSSTINTISSNTLWLKGEDTRAASVVRSLDNDCSLSAALSLSLMSVCGDLYTVVLVLGGMPFHLDHFHRIVNVGKPDIPDGARHVEHELANSYGARQGLGRGKYLAGEHSPKEVAIHLFLAHVIDVAQHGFSLHCTRRHHDQGDAPAVRPVTSFTQENPAQLGVREVIGGIGAIDYDGQRPIGWVRHVVLGSRRTRRNAGRRL